LQVMFEKYKFHGLYIAIQAVLTLYAQGKIIRFARSFDIAWYATKNVP